MTRFSLYRATVAVVALAGTALSAHAKEDNAGDDLSALASMSLEDLADIEISSVSKRMEKRTAAAAAIHVITAEDIRRSTATSLPDLLRAVPGVHVAALDASIRSISIRGFSGRYANKLLVLVDGRSVYTPLFSGVVWEIQDLMLENIERIEIIRGPGGTLWGANAVNGVINITTKNAADTQGGLVSAGAGTEYPGFGAIRYGGTAGEQGHYRLHLRYLGRDDRASFAGRRAEDEADYFRGGTRWDWDWGATQFTLIGDLYGTQTSQVIDVPGLLLPLPETRREDTYYSGGSLLGRWTHTRANGGELRLQAYYDRAETNNILLDENRDTFDLELQYQLPPLGRHEFMWGANFRYYRDRVHGTPVARYDPPEQRKRLFSAFVQDRISFLDDRLALTLGTKVEHNDFTGFEIQPSARLAWTPNDKHTLWAAVSRAVRTPAITDEAVDFAGLAIPGLMLTFVGNADFKSEELLALEAGYRVALTDALAVDLALFHNTYDNLRSTEIGLPYLDAFPRPPHLAIPAIGRNNMEGTVYGGELALNWQVRPWWRLHMNYSYLEMDLDNNPDSFDPVSAVMEESDPQHQVYIESNMDISEKFEIDVAMRFVDQLPALGIDDYVTMDVRLAWTPSDDFEIAIVGHDLLGSKHVEYDSQFVNTAPTQVQRGVYGKVTWRF